MWAHLGGRLLRGGQGQPPLQLLRILLPLQLDLVGRQQQGLGGEGVGVRTQVQTGGAVYSRASCLLCQSLNSAHGAVSRETQQRQIPKDRTNSGSHTGKMRHAG